MRRLSRALAAAPLLAFVAAAEPPVGDWVGGYDCAQGSTALDLHVAMAPDGHLDALFHFAADASNPRVPEGCFTMAGSWDPASGAVRLTAADWLLRPPGYVTVDLAGTVGEGAFAGTVLGPGCTAFRLQRTDAPAPSRRPAACPRPRAAASSDGQSPRGYPWGHPALRHPARLLFCRPPRRDGRAV